MCIAISGLDEGDVQQNVDSWKGCTMYIYVCEIIYYITGRTDPISLKGGSGWATSKSKRQNWNSWIFYRPGSDGRTGGVGCGSSTAPAPTFNPPPPRECAVYVHYIIICIYILSRVLCRSTCDLIYVSGRPATTNHLLVLFFLVYYEFWIFYINVRHIVLIVIVLASETHQTFSRFQPPVPSLLLTLHDYHLMEVCDHKVNSQNMFEDFSVKAC